MKRKLTLLFVLAGIVLTTYSQEKYAMWETMYLTPKSGKTEDLKKGMAEHNKKYHAKDPYTAHVWNIFTGKHEGEWLWAMGPCTFTDLDSRPEGEEHDKDWAENVEAYLEKSSDLRYWRLDEKLSYNPENAPMGKVIWTSYDVKDFEGYRFDEMLKKVVEVYKQKNYPNSMLVYESQFASEDGMDVVIEWSFDKWAFFDKEDKFVKDYEEIHGEGTWKHFMEEYRDIVVKAVDELAEYMPELSGGN